MGTKLRYGLVGAFGGVLTGVLVAVPAAAIAYGRETTEAAHRADVYLWAFLGAVVFGVVGFVVGWLRTNEPRDRY
ncbi:MAG: hypothetical protein N2037_02715 [Acidimicrobiales bacterium]|nr:hypothetical protein [Acidimicrobiales bacterium]